MLFKAEHKSRSDGFSLVELMVAVAITGILASISLPLFFQHFQKTCQAEAASKLNLLANSVSAYKDINGSAPTQWVELNEMSAVMTTAGPANASDGALTSAITVPSCDYTITRSSERTGEEFIFVASPTPNTGDKADYNAMSCLDLNNGASDIRIGRKDATGAVSTTDLICWRP